MVELFGKKIHEGGQGKHIIGHNNYKEGRSILYGTIEEAQNLADEFAGTGKKIGDNKERRNFGRIIGQYVDQQTGEVLETSNGIIHYSKKGIHIVPARP